MGMDEDRFGHAIKWRKDTYNGERKETWAIHVVSTRILAVAKGPSTFRAWEGYFQMYGFDRVGVNTFWHLEVQKGDKGAAKEIKRVR